MAETTTKTSTAPEPSRTGTPESRRRTGGSGQQCSRSNVVTAMYGRIAGWAAAAERTPSASSALGRVLLIAVLVALGPRPALMAQDAVTPNATVDRRADPTLQDFSEARGAASVLAAGLREEASLPALSVSVGVDGRRSATPISRRGRPRRGSPASGSEASARA